MSARTLSRCLCAGLIALVIIIAAWSASGTGRPGATVVAAVPLLLPLPGLWRGSRYTAAWSSLLIVPYMLFGIVEVIADPAARALAGVELFLSLAVFAGLLVLARGRRRPPP